MPNPNPDFNDQVQISFAPVPPGASSCVSDAALAEIARRMRLTIPQKNNQQGICASTQDNNLFEVDGAGCGYVASIQQYSQQLDWNPSAPADLTFNGWPSTLDATSDLLTWYAIIASTDLSAARVAVKSVTANTVVIQVSGAASVVSVILTLTQFPVPTPTS